MTRYSVTLERDDGDGYRAWVHELPGCIAYGTSREEALANVPAAIVRFLDWLRSVGEEAREEPVTFDIVEPAAAAERTVQGGTGVLLTWDQEPLTPEEWKRIERWLERSRRELHDTQERMGEDDLGIAAREDARTIWQQLRHIATVEFMYALWTFDLRTKGGVRGLLEWTRQMAASCMRALAEQRDQGLTYAQWAGTGTTHPEPWTARKAARRLVYHERWHLNSIRRLLQGFRGSAASGGRT